MARKKTNLVSLAVEYLRNKILIYELKPGTPISDSKIAQEMTESEGIAISRSPVREALFVLQSEGFVEVINSKICVARISARDVIEICQVRDAIEQQAVMVVCSNGGYSKTQKELFCSLYDSMLEKRSAGDLQKAYEIDDKFHMYLVECSGNARLFEIAKLMRNQMQRVRWLNMIYPDMSNQCNEEHADILSGVLADDSEKTVKAVHYHNEKTRERFQGIFDSDFLRLATACFAEN